MPDRTRKHFECVDCDETWPGTSDTSNLFQIIKHHNIFEHDIEMVARTRFDFNGGCDRRPF